MKLIRDKFQIQDYHTMKRYIKKQGKCTIVIEAYLELLSEAQRGYYFGVVVASCMKSERWAGKTKERVHMELKTLYLPDYEELLSQFTPWMTIPEIVQRFLTIYHDLTITSETKWEFEGYLSRIRMWEGAEWISIPLPNEKDWDWASLVK